MQSNDDVQTMRLKAEAEIEQQKRETFMWWWKQIRNVLLAILALILASMWGCPQYRVYERRLEGEGILARAHAERQVLVQQATAEKDSAALRAQAIGIVGEAAKQYPEYRQQEFIGAFAEALHNGRVNQIIYVPTEAGIPILEAHRHALAPAPVSK